MLATAAARSSGARVSEILPRITRPASSRSSVMRARCRVWRVMMPVAVATLGSSVCRWRSITCDALVIAASGLRSSWPSIARNSSLALLARSAASRASCSRWKDDARSSCAFASATATRRTSSSRVSGIDGASPRPTRVALSSSSCMGPTMVRPTSVATSSPNRMENTTAPPNTMYERVTGPSTTASGCRPRSPSLKFRAAKHGVHRNTFDRARDRAAAKLARTSSISTRRGRCRSADRTVWLSERATTL